MTAVTYRVSCGLDFSHATDIMECRNTATDKGFDFLCVPLVHPRFKREFISGKCKDRPGPFTRSDLVLAGADWSQYIVGKLSSYINVDCSDQILAKMNEFTLNQELSYACHLNLAAVIIRLYSGHNVNLARIIHSKTCAITNYQIIWVQIPMVSPATTSNYVRQNATDVEVSTWHWWHDLRTLCNNERKLSIALEVTADLPSENEISRWLGEPISCLILSTSLFLTNKKGFPVLSQQHQLLLKRMATLNLQVVITGANLHESYKFYKRYLDHLWQSISPSGAFKSYSSGYEDFLQFPLQPLMDNLESNTYEVFEKDPIKYSEYQQAIYLALLDRSQTELQNSTAVVMVVGAGRGPLVNAALAAARKANRKIKVYAVEKNANAVVTLQTHQRETWGDQVEVIACDMREWNAPEKADIMVSELLGSFGDNELSPECLDGAQKLLKDDGISIPCQYTSYLNPVQSSKLYNEARIKESAAKPLAHFETPYVVHQNNRFTLAPHQPVFTFHHPNKDECPDNQRYATLSFSIKDDCILHGFSGYFDAVLYADVVLSIVPDAAMKGMFSWFPIYFPIKEPVFLRANDELVVHFWRRCTSKNVWYEWAISKPIAIPVHNINGRSYTIGL